MGSKHGARQKGCPMCKMHKFKDHGHAVRMPIREVRKLGKRKRISRHDLGDAA